MTSSTKPNALGKIKASKKKQQGSATEYVTFVQATIYVCLNLNILLATVIAKRKRKKMQSYNSVWRLMKMYRNCFDLNHRQNTSKVVKCAIIRFVGLIG